MYEWDAPLASRIRKSLHTFFMFLLFCRPTNGSPLQYYNLKKIMLFTHTTLYKHTIICKWRGKIYCKKKTTKRKKQKHGQNNLQIML